MTESAPQSTSTATTCVIVVGVIMALVILAYAATSLLKAARPAMPTPTADPLHNAWYGCTTFIQKQLGLSFMDAQVYNPGGITALGGGEFKVRVFYARTASLYECDLLQQSDGMTRLLALNVLR